MTDSQSNTKRHAHTFQHQVAQKFSVIETLHGLANRAMIIRRIRIAAIGAYQPVIISFIGDETPGALLGTFARNKRATKETAGGFDGRARP